MYTTLFMSAKCIITNVTTPAMKILHCCNFGFWACRIDTMCAKLTRAAKFAPMKPFRGISHFMITFQEQKLILAERECQNQSKYQFLQQECIKVTQQKSGVRSC